MEDVLSSMDYTPQEVAAPVFDKPMVDCSEVSVSSTEDADSIQGLVDLIASCTTDTESSPMDLCPPVDELVPQWVDAQPTYFLTPDQYDLTSDPVVSVLTYENYQTILIYRLHQLQAVASSRSLIPRLRELRGRAGLPQGRMSSMEMGELVRSVKSEMEQADGLIRILHPDCWGGLKERDPEMTGELEMMLRVFNLTWGCR